MKFEVDSVGGATPPCGGVKKGTCVNIRYTYYYVDINSLEELMEFINKLSNDVIIQRSYKVDCVSTIMIYDDYLE